MDTTADAMMKLLLEIVMHQYEDNILYFLQTEGEGGPLNNKLHLLKT